MSRSGMMDWRPMMPADLDGAMRVQEEAHPWFLESADLFAERLRLYPQGCLVLADERGVAGYLLSHPWRAAEPPPLDTLLGALPKHPGTYYLHDLALLARAHGGGHGARAVARIAGHAEVAGFASLSLVAVNGSSPFWARLGFRPWSTPELAAKLASYGADAMFMTRASAPQGTTSTACPPPSA